jgi:hypothetical protein
MPFACAALFALCPHIVDICASEAQLRGLLRHMRASSSVDASTTTFRALSVTLRDRPLPLRTWAHDDDGASPLAQAVERLRLPALALAFAPGNGGESETAAVALLMDGFPRLTHVALPVAPGHLRTAVRWFRRRGVPLQMVVLTVQAGEWLALHGGGRHYARAAFERLHVFAAERDPRVHVVLVPYAADGPSAREVWLAEAWGEESIWEKAARTRRRLAHMIPVAEPEDAVPYHIRTWLAETE